MPKAKTTDPVDACSKITKNPTIPVSENGRAFVIKNPDRQQVKIVKVDGCLVTDHRERCDYCFEVNDPIFCVIYLELKGSDIAKAFQQICATLQHLSDRHKEIKKKFCHIVASRVPKAGPAIQVLQVKMQNQHKAMLKVGTTKVEIDLSKEPYI